MSVTRVPLAATTTLTAGDLVIGRVKLTDGTDVADVLDLTNSNPLTVAIVDGSGDQITSFGGGTQYTEADTDASITGTAMLMEGAGNALVPVQGTAADGVLVNLGANNDVTVSGSVAVTGTFWQATQPVSGTVTANLAAGTNNIGDVDVLSVPAPLSTTGGGTEATALRVTVASDSTGVLSVDDNGGSLTVDAPVGTPVFVRLSDGGSAISTLPVSLASVPSHAVTNAGTFAVQVDGSALTALQLIDDPVFADDAAFTVGTSKVMASGIQAVAHGSTPDVADALDAVIPLANRHRIPFMLGGHPNLQSSEYITTTAATDDNILPAISAGTIYVITGITVTASAANTVNTSVRIGFGGTTVPAQGASQADAVAKVLLSHPGIAPGSGVVKGNAGGIVGIGGDGEELRITTSAPTSGSLVVQVDWFTIPS